MFSVDMIHSHMTHNVHRLLLIHMPTCAVNQFNNQRTLNHR